MTTNWKNLLLVLFLLLVLIGASVSIGWFLAPLKTVEVTRVVTQTVVEVVTQNVTQIVTVPEVRQVAFFYPPEYSASDNFTLLGIEDTIKWSEQGASAHVYYLKRDKDIEHNSFWRDVHQSASYWLERLRAEATTRAIEKGNEK